MSRALAVNAVGARALEQAAAELGERVFGQLAVGVERVGKRQSRDEQRVELERAVVALRAGREVGRR